MLEFKVRWTGRRYNIEWEEKEETMQKVICDRCKVEITSDGWKMVKQTEEPSAGLDICDKCVGEIKGGN